LYWAGLQSLENKEMLELEADTERVGSALSPAGSRTWPRSGIDNSGWCWSLEDAICLVKLVLQSVGGV
jgi:hypothetical protein